ncbi:hypothetical protein, partial [Novacetimonas hansenii]|uniref:hypothetical protein n=1 Tax=Novacetimonas hansenii TaxID=436 RepID=UPI001A7ED4EB
LFEKSFTKNFYNFRMLLILTFQTVPWNLLKNIPQVLSTGNGERFQRINLFFEILFLYKVFFQKSSSCQQVPAPNFLMQVSLTGQTGPCNLVYK